jgi:hypothetical protein
VISLHALAAFQQCNPTSPGKRWAAAQKPHPTQLHVWRIATRERVPF